MKNIVDNFEPLARVLFDRGPLPEGEFYFVQVLVRGKDGNPVNGNNKNRLVRFYCVKSADRLRELKPEIVALCELHNARAYVHPTPRSERDVAAVMLESVAHEFAVGNYHVFRRLYSTACGQSFVAGKKLFIVDMDTLPGEDFVAYTARYNDTVQILTACRGKAGDGENKVVANVLTKNGTHILATPFDVGQFEQELRKRNLPVPDIHKNNPTLLYYPGESDAR